jgi:hypothetical protein
LIGNEEACNYINHFVHSYNRNNNIKVVLCTPAVIGEKTDLNNIQGLDTDLDKYASIIRNIAKNNNCSLIDPA